MSTILGAINANSEKSFSISEKMLGMLDNKSAGKESETTTEEVVVEELKVPKEKPEDEEELKKIREELVTVKDDFNKLCTFVKTLAERVSV
jgi:archaellum component FlaC